MVVQLVAFNTECERVADGSLRIRARGELDMATASVLRQALVDCIRRRPARLVVDLADVPFIDASGLRVLIDARNRQHEVGGELLIGRHSPQVARMLEIAGSRTELPLADDQGPPA